MSNRLTLSAGLIAAGLLATPLGLTAALAQAPAAKAQSDMKEFQIAKTSKGGLAQALTTAEAQGEKSHAINADFEKADGKNPTHYIIKVVYPDGKLVEYDIDAETGALYKTENQPIERYFTRLKPADFQNATTSLKDAIAERKAGGGKAYEAEVEREQTVKVGPDGKVVGD
ncbi:PepSY domain-containing protein [Methylobacterium sp. WL120]|uniref:PepSY domain-containing protein n=1 Tax=Methylobacterium sp. WL120 TaxID=2603887 RepID=UPI0011C85B67|nr:PepSY domain-containing protein [Methylobacterium sp. WL120]TXM65858.1 PepSY domain-containing protein [Methylobacterium sp. WL120]